MAASRLRKRIRKAFIAFGIGATAWMFLNMQAWNVDPDVLQSSFRVAVSTSATTLAFVPRSDTAAVGLLFYPGALVDPNAYAPMARAVAEEGYKVVIVKLPFRLAPFVRHSEELASRTLQLIREGGTAHAWVIGGHSRGGALAAKFVRQHEPDVAGLLLVGTSHPKRFDFSALAIDDEDLRIRRRPRKC